MRKVVLSSLVAAVVLSACGQVSPIQGLSAFNLQADASDVGPADQANADRPDDRAPNGDRAGGRDGQRPPRQDGGCQAHDGQGGQKPPAPPAPAAQPAPQGQGDEQQAGAPAPQGQDGQQPPAPPAQGRRGQRPPAPPAPPAKDDNGHGNDPGKVDPSNPGNSKPDAEPAPADG